MRDPNRKRRPQPYIDRREFMSRHYFDCQCEGRKVRVILGYDRPLDAMFMNVERLTHQGGSTMNHVYASISDPEGDGSMDYYADKLKSLGIDAPECLFLAVW